MADGDPANRSAPEPLHETERLDALRAYRILDTPPEEEFDELTRLASWICGTPIALVSLVDAHRQWFKANLGMPDPETPREVAFCAHTIMDDGLFEVTDAQADARFADNPLVTDQHIRFYAGAPLRTPEGHNVGALCVMDRVPRELTDIQREALATLGRQVIARLELRRALRETVQAAEARAAAQAELMRQTTTLRAVLHSMGEGVIVASGDGQLEMLNSAAERMLGQPRQPGLPPAEWPRKYQLYLPDGLTRFPAESLPLVRAMKGEAVDDVDLCLRAEGMPRRWVSAMARPLRDEQADTLLGGIVVFRDVTERRQIEGRLRAQHTIARILADAQSLPDAAPHLLHAIAQYSGWDVGELWTMDPWDDVLRMSSSWRRDDPSLAGIVEAGAAMSFGRGEGLPGRVWAKGEPILGKVGEGGGMVREDLAARTGLHATIAFPVTSGSRLLGVMVFWSCEPQLAEAHLNAFLLGLGTQIGEFVARRQAEQALRHSEERLRTLFQRTPYPALIHDEASLSILLVNDAALHEYGYTKDELLRLTLSDIRVPGSEEIGGLSAAGTGVVWTHRRKDGTGLRVEERSQALELEGRPARCVFVRDLTEQLRSDEAMAERLALSALSAAVNNSLTWGGTLHRKLQDCAQALVAHLGLELAGVWRRSATDPALDLLGASVRDGTLPASQSRLALREHWLGTITESCAPQWLDLAKDTMPRELSWTAGTSIRYLAGYPLVAENRSLGVLALGSAQPLRAAVLEAVPALADEIALYLEREEVRAALTASEARHRAVLENMLGGLLVVDERGFIESANAEAERIFGYARGQLVGQHLSVLMPPGMIGEATGTLRDAFKKAISRITEWEGRRRSGEVFPFELALYEIETPAGRRFGGHIRDLSERREVERLKKEFVAVVSHELRTPLTSIRGSLSLLAGGALGDLPDEAKEVVTIADRNTVRLIHLINDILDLERLEAGRMPMYVSLHPVREVCERAVDAVRAVADLQGVAIDVRPMDAHVLGDADRLVQVIVNLLSNAVKFSASGAAVVVSAAEDDGWVEVRVQDHGRGIPSSYHEAIFHRFRQVESSDGRMKGGTGLGLPICKAIVEQLGGTIGVDSQLGQGSTFWFRLRSRRPETADDGLLAAMADAIPEGAADVLLLDEDEALLGVVGRQLLSAGIPVRIARTVRQGIELARSRAPSLLMLDVRFPDGDGFEVVRALAADEALRQTPLLVYTSRDLTDVERERLRLGRSRFLTKSQASEQDLLEAVRELRERRGGE
jgi:PAS domain S-box-containing protein